MSIRDVKGPKTPQRFLNANVKISKHNIEIVATSPPHTAHLAQNKSRTAAIGPLKTFIVQKTENTKG